MMPNACRRGKTSLFAWLPDGHERNCFGVFPLDQRSIPMVLYIDRGMIIAVVGGHVPKYATRNVPPFNFDVVTINLRSFEVVRFVIAKCGVSL